MAQPFPHLPADVRPPRPPATASAQRHRLAVSARAALLLVPLTAARGLQAVARRLTRLALRVADPEAAQRLTEWSYGRADEYEGGPLAAAGWLDFERAAVAAWFPPAPARILVPGCGGGRELQALTAEGHACAGYDPVARLVAAAQGHVPGVPVAVGTLQHPPDAGVFAGPFDGILVGWCAWGFVLTEADRVNALKAMRKVCPQGPILLSWRMERQAGLRGESRTVAAVLSGGPAAADWRDRVVVPAIGRIQAQLGRADVEREAAAAGERVGTFGSAAEHGCAHAVLVPREA